MVEEHELQKEKIQEDYNDKYWDQRYTIVQHRIPSFLQKMADKILSTGKKQTNKQMSNSKKTSLKQDIDFLSLSFCREIPECGAGVRPRCDVS